MLRSQNGRVSKEKLQKYPNSDVEKNVREPRTKPVKAEGVNNLSFQAGFPTRDSRDLRRTI